jgi:hypothetical protein
MLPSVEGYRKHSILFEKLGASIVAASVDSFEDTKLLAEGSGAGSSGTRF